MKYDKLSRRFFLQGLGGSILTLPILPSIMPRAHAAVLPNDKFLVMIGSPHGGTGRIGDWAPMPALDVNSQLLNRHTLLPVGGVDNIDHIIRHARLSGLLTANPGHAGGNVDSSQDRISFILGSFFNPYIEKMNLYNGIDIGTFYSGHHRGVYSGNIAHAVNNPDARDAMEHWPSLDQFLANHPGFYSDPASTSVKSITNVSTMGHAGDGTFIPATASRGDRLYTAIFDKFDKTLTPQEVAEREKKDFLIDRVYEDYRRFLRGAHGPARTISSVDKLRVEQHIDNLVDIQNKYKQIINSCGDVTGPNDRVSVSTYSTTTQSWDVLTDLIVAAFNCGATRLAGFMLPENVIGFSGNYHQEVAHGASTDPGRQLLHNQNFRWQAQNAVLKMVQKLDSVSVNGQTGSILDNGLVTWTHECGTKTHSNQSVGLATFGSLGGHFKTGNYVDYRNQKNMGLLNRDLNESRPGIPIQRFWANVVQGFGVTRAQFERNGKPGYGDSSRNDYTLRFSQTTVNNGHHAYPPRIMNSLSDLLPVVT